MKFELINKGYNSVFQPNQLSVGIVVPIENYASNPVPTMKHHLARVQLIDQLGFKALWLRDVLFNVPTFGDAGQTFDPFAYLGYLAGLTTDKYQSRFSSFSFTIVESILRQRSCLCSSVLSTLF